MRGYAEEHSAALDISKTRLELKMFDLVGTADQVQTLELEYVEPPTLDLIHCSKRNRTGGFLTSEDFHTHVITFSPDLSNCISGRTHI